MTRLAWASAQSDPFLRNPNEGIVCQGCLKKGRKMGFCLFVVIWRILISRKLVPILWREGVQEQNCLSSYLNRVRAWGGLIRSPGILVHSRFSDTQLFRILRRNFEFFAYFELNLSSPLGVGNVFGAFSVFFSCYTTLIKESLALSGLICNPLLLVTKSQEC